MPGYARLDRHICYPWSTCVLNYALSIIYESRATLGLPKVVAFDVFLYHFIVLFNPPSLLDSYPWTGITYNIVRLVNQFCQPVFHVSV